MNSILAVILVAATTLFASPAAAGLQTVQFAANKVEVSVPEDFVLVGKSSGGVAFVFGTGKDHKLELSLNEITDVDVPANVGETFVRAQAQKKGLKLHESRDRVVFMEPRGDFKDGDKTMRVVHWQIGFGRAVVVMTVSAPMPMGETLKEFLGAPLNKTINSLHLLRQ